MEQKTTNKLNIKSKIFTIPNIMSMFRIVLLPFIVLIYCVDKNYVLAGAMLVFSGFTDIVDGYIARHFNMTSDLGKMLDPIADKLTQAVMLICLWTRFPLMACPFILMALKESFMLISGYLLIKKVGVVPYAIWHGKAATALLYSMVIIHIFWSDIPEYISNIAILACSGMIAISLVLYLIKNVQILSRSKSAKNIKEQ